MKRTILILLLGLVLAVGILESGLDAPPPSWSGGASTAPFANRASELDQWLREQARIHGIDPDLLKIGAAAGSSEA